MAKKIRIGYEEIVVPLKQEIQGQIDDSIEDSEKNIIKRVVETKTVQGLIEPNLPNGQDLLLNVKRSVLSNWEVEAQAESSFVIPGTRYGEVKVGDRLYFTTGLEGFTNLGAQGFQTFKINYYDIVTKKFGVLYEDNNLYMAFFNNGFTYDPINEDFYILCGDVYGYNAKEVLGSQKLSEFIKPFKINKNTLIKTEVANVYNNDNEVLRVPNGAVYYNGKIYVSYGEKYTITGKTWATADEVAFDNSKNAIEEIVLSPVTNITQMQTLFPVDTYEVGTVIATVYEGTKTYYRVGLVAVSGGKDSNLKIYDIETNTWSLGATPPDSIGTQHQQGTSIIVDNKIYVKRSLLFNVYDITTNTWSSLQSPLVGDVHNEAPAHHNGYIYYGGGFVGGGSVTPVVPEARNSDIVQRYNISTNTWELHSRLPNLVNELQGYGSLIVKDNFMYYLLGYVYNHEDHSITYVNKTVYKYDLSKGTSYYQYDDNLLKENVDGLYVSKTELKGITDEQITEHDNSSVSHEDIREGVSQNTQDIKGLVEGDKSFKVISFDTGYTGGLEIGQTKWNDDFKCLETRVSNSVTIQHNQEQVQYVRAVSGNPLNGQALYVSGSTGQRLNVALANNNITSQVRATIGVATENFSNIDGNQYGFMCTYGLVNGLNTSVFTTGEPLYLGINGILTNIRPTGKAYVVRVAIVGRIHSTNGSIMVAPVYVPTVAELSQVSVTNIQEDDVLLYGADGVVRNSQRLKIAEEDIVSLGEQIASLPSPLTYVGGWDALTNTPVLVNNDTSKKGQVYRVTVSATRFGIVWEVKDLLVYNKDGVVEKWDVTDPEGYEVMSNKITTWGTPTNEQYASAKLVYDTKATKLNIPQYTIPYRNTSGAGEPNTNFLVSEHVLASTIPARYTNGRLKVGTAVDNDDAVNLLQANTNYFRNRSDLGTTDLNTLNTYEYAGIYWQTGNSNVTLERNYPIDGKAGLLRVYRSYIQGSVMQEYTTLSLGESTDGTYIRKLVSGAWTSWIKFATEDWTNTQLDNMLGIEIWESGD